MTLAPAQLAEHPSAPLVPRFSARYTGYDRAFGIFKPASVSEGVKARGKAMTITGSVTQTHYAQHLAGEPPSLGIIMLRGDETVLFAAIDIDDYNVDHGGWAKKIAALQLPLVVCRSKSGGAHLYLFLSEPVPAVVVRKRLVEYVALLGLPAKTEVFPKQTQRLGAEDVGNWINLPYFGGDTSERHAFGDEGEKLPLMEFLRLADARAQSRDSMQRTALPVLDQTLFVEGPPCLQFFEAQGGFPQGGKRNGMFSVGVYLRKAFPDDWEERLAGYNERMCNGTKLSTGEIEDLRKSLRRKEYHYKCSDTPINSACQKGLCKSRLHGVGAALPGQTDTHTDPAHQCDITSVTKYISEGDDPLWYIELEMASGKVCRIKLSHDEFFNVQQFNKRCFGIAGIIPAKVNQQRWMSYVEQLASAADIVPLPEDVSEGGQLSLMVQEFFEIMPRAATREAFAAGGRTLVENGRVFFRSQDLRKFLEGQRFDITLVHTFDYLRHGGGDSVQWHVGPKVFRVWSMPLSDNPAPASTIDVDTEMVDPSEAESPFPGRV